MQWQFVNYGRARSRSGKPDGRQRRTANTSLHKTSYTYDDDLRLSNVTIDTDVLTAEQIAAYQYYLTGALKRKELGNNLQGLDYIYTINGQLKSINHPSLDPEKDPGKDGAAGGSGSGRDVFGMSIDYHTNDYVRTGSDITSSSTGATSHYNGLIDAVRWKVLYEPDIIKSGAPDETLISDTDQEVMYRFHYNAFNWIDSARFGVFDAGSPSFTLKDSYRLWGDGTGTAIQYDDNGNIQNLKRNGYSGGDPGGLVMDELNYTYTANTNKLASILDDAITSYTNDFDAATSKSFTYNAIGQMTASEAEGIDEVAYTPSGKVEYVAYSNNDTAFYWYNDKGQKYKSQLKPNGGNSVFTWYVNDAAGNIMGIYSFTEGGDSIKLAEQPVYADGRVGLLHPAQDSVVYEVTDHQGNVRVAFTEHGDSTHIVAWTDFYPFGSPMPGRYENSSDYRFSYQGQEKAVGDDQNTGWDHFELRMYNGQLGRFISPDPMGQFHSPYVGMGNSPINGSDPTGGYMAFGVDNVGGHAESVRQRMEWREFVRFKDFMYQNGGGFYNPVTGQMDYKGQSAEQMYHLGMRAPNDWGRSDGGFNENLSFGQMAERAIDQLESKYTRYTSEWIDARRAIMNNYTAASQQGKLIPDREEEGPVNRLNDEMPVVDDIDYNRLAVYQGMREAGARWGAERAASKALEVVQGIAVGYQFGLRPELFASMGGGGYIIDYNDMFASVVENIVGKAYVRGKNGPDKFDCSGAVCYGVRKVNSNFGDYSAHGLFSNFTTPTFTLQRGSLIFYDYKSDGRIDHVTTVLSNAYMVHPSSSKGVIELRPLDYLNSYTTEQGGTIYYRNINWNLINTKYWW